MDEQEREQLANAMAARFLKTPGLKDSLTEMVGVKAPKFAWLNIHGLLCLALRHPDAAPVGSLIRDVVTEFVRRLGTGFVDWGLMTDEEVAAIEKLDVAPGPWPGGQG